MANHWKTDPVDFDYMINSGLLFEINRTCMHLFGIGITVKKDEKGNKSFGFKDCRNVAGTLVFSEEMLKVGRVKLERFLSEFGHPQMDKRSEALGVCCQHVDCWVGGKK